MTMAIHLTVDYKAQILADIVSGLTREESREASEHFDKAVANVLEHYKRVKIDEQYKRYGLDIGLVSDSKSELGDACHDIANITQEHPLLKDIYFESFEGILHD